MKSFSVFLLSVVSTMASEIESGPWSGAVTTHGAVVKVVPKPGVSKIRLKYGEGDDQGQWKSISPQKTSGEALGFQLSGLKPAQTYHYGIEVDGLLENGKLGSLHTFPLGAASFHFAFASCTRTGSASPVFCAIQNEKPLFYLNTGDLHYEDIDTNDPEEFREAFRQVLASPTQSSLYRNVPVVYMWDDHDYAGNNSHGKSKARSAARQVYQELVPHYPLVEGSGDVAIYQSFVVGRVKFIITDLRSERSEAEATDDASKTMMGAKQKAWFKRELLASKNKHPLIFWISSVAWISKTPKIEVWQSDFWGSYSTERRELADFIADNRITGLCLLSGDAHMLAADDGTNSDFSSHGGPKIRVLQAGSLDRPKSLKGGPYSQGTYLPKPGEGCYGLVHVEDDGGGIRASFSGRNHQQHEKISLKFTTSNSQP